MKHNKKRNTAFLYEALVQELTKSVVEKDNNKKSQIVKILKEHFSKGKVLAKELSLYKSINETRDMERNLAEKILYEARMEYSFLPKDDIFKEQSRVINKINKEVSSSVFSNFVKNYKDLASISQIFSGELPVKQRVLLEETLLETMCSQVSNIKEEMKPIDQLTYKTFIKKFNEKYSGSLLKEQKELLSNYLTSFSDNGLSLKIYLNEELERVKQKVRESMNLDEIKQDESMLRKTNKIFQKLESFKEKEIDQQMLGELLKIQHFVSEAQVNGE